MMLNPSATELTTAATDAVLGAFCVGLSWWLNRLPGPRTWGRSVWVWVLGLLGCASVLGTVAHGLDLSASVREGIWQPLYLALGLTVALFLIAAIRDWRGEKTARALLPWAVALAVGFFALTHLLGGAFDIFVAYEATALTAALAIYLWLLKGGRVAGNGMVAAGIALSLVAAAVQLSSWSLTVVVPFDHNGLFHLVQIVGTAVLARGLSRRV